MTLEMTMELSKRWVVELGGCAPGLTDGLSLNEVVHAGAYGDYQEGLIPAKVLGNNDARTEPDIQVVSYAAGGL